MYRFHFHFLHVYNGIFHDDITISQYTVTQSCLPLRRSATLPLSVFKLFQIYRSFCLRLSLHKAELGLK